MEEKWKKEKKEASVVRVDCGRETVLDSSLEGVIRQQCLADCCNTGTIKNDVIG